MKRKVSVILLITLLLLQTISLTACNKPAKMKYVVGTYKLVKHTVTKYEQGTEDIIEKLNKEEYLVVTGKDKGWYVYKDKDTPIEAKEVKLSYYNTDKGELNSISFVTDNNDKSKSVRVDFREEKSLISRWSTATKINDAYDIKYLKISNAKDLSAVKKIHPDLTVFEYGLYKYNRLYKCVITNGLNNFSEYIYKFIDIDSSNLVATTYYALKQDKIQVVRTDNITFVKNDEESVTKMIINSEEYIRNDGYFMKEIRVDVNGVIADEYEKLEYQYEEITDAYLSGLIAEYESR